MRQATADRMIRALGPDAAVELAGRLQAYANRHASCTVRDVEILALGDELRVLVVHEPGCPDAEEA